MVSKEQKLLEKYAPQHAELQTLWDDHKLFEKQVEKMESKPFMTPDEKIRLAELKKQKLDTKTKMYSMLDQLDNKELSS